MSKKHGPGTSLMRILSLIALLASVPALSHDPLRDEYDRRRGDHHAEQHHNLPKRVNLSEVRALVVVFRETGDDRNLDAAWALLEPALKSPSPDSETLITASFVAQSRHEFEYAVQLITKALAIEDNNDEGWLLLASIQLVLGETESAARACRQLRNVPPVVLLTCKARVALANGDHQIAFTRLNSILNMANSRRLPPDVLAWSYSVAGDLAVAAGESDQAVMQYEHSLVLTERTQVRAALVDVLLSQADYENAWQALDDGSPALPLLVRRLIVAKRLGRMHELQSMLSTVEQEFELWIANEDWLHAREMARFFIDVLDKPDLARRLALINIGLQQEPEDQRLERRTRPSVTRQSRSINSTEYRLDLFNLFEPDSDDIS